MTSYALYNAKGGVGKTTSAVNLACLAASEGRRTLLWDLDPQGSASFYLRVPPVVEGGVKKLVRGKLDLARVVRKTAFGNLDLLPSDFSARKLDTYLRGAGKPKKALMERVAELEGKYDVVFLDPPPGFSLVTDNLLRAADFLLVPLIPTPLSVRAYLALADYAGGKGAAACALLPFFTLVDARKRLHAEVLRAYLGERGSADGAREAPGGGTPVNGDAGPVPAETAPPPPRGAPSPREDARTARGAARDFKDGAPAVRFLGTWIPYASEVEKMGLRCAPLSAFAKGSKAETAYRELWEEVKGVTLEA